MKSTRKAPHLKFATCLQILVFLNNRSIVHFCRWGVGWGVKKLVKKKKIFCEHHNFMVTDIKNYFDKKKECF